jgi:hypothetical protein
MQKARFSPTRMDFPKNSSGGGVEYWNNGVLEFWGVGVLEDWLFLSTVRFASEQSAERVVRWWKICMVWFEETPRAERTRRSTRRWNYEQPN